MDSIPANRKKKNKPIIFELALKSNPREVVKIEKFLNQLARKIQIDDGTMYRLLISCTEAVNNAIIHGNNSDINKYVNIRFSIGRHRLTIRIKDEGKGFSVSKIPNPLDRKNILKEDGRGIFLMQSLMDDVIFRKLKSGHVVQMKLRI